MASLTPAKETAFEKVRGLWIAIPTPFSPTGEIDEGVLRFRKRVLRWHEG